MPGTPELLGAESLQMLPQWFQVEAARQPVDVRVDNPTLPGIQGFIGVGNDQTDGAFQIDPFKRLGRNRLELDLKRQLGVGRQVSKKNGPRSG